jgi:uncharacterized protein (DUF433 family)
VDWRPNGREVAIGLGRVGDTLMRVCNNHRVVARSKGSTDLRRPPSTAAAREAGRPVAIDKFRTGKAYTVAQAARLTGTTPATVRRWLKGYDVPGHHMAPVFGPESKDARRLSFLELVELTVASRFRNAADPRKSVPLEKIRRAHAYAREQWGLPYPFASLRLARHGGHILREFDETEPGSPRLALDVGGQWTLPAPVQEELNNQLDFASSPEDPFAIRWYPYGRDVPIVVDPHRAAGQPTVEGRAITIETLRRRRDAGEPPTSLARDYELPVHVVETVLDRAA